MTDIDPRAAREEARRQGHLLFDPIAEEYLPLDGVDIGRMFGSDGLRIRGKVFAFVGFAGDLMLKLPASRIDALAAEGVAARMVMRGREMREWLRVEQDRPEQWAPLTAEAYAFLDEITP
ncbi:TfoX/Sxy family protein [Microbacterium sp. X-17]|uniref:TfoX/Sxy family protein n=1 Tax=Microbacterium sp. X-17 TaxID=3144404 RepID=UPI0031F4ED6D